MNESDSQTAAAAVRPWRIWGTIGVALVLFFTLRYALPISEPPTGFRADQVRIGLAILVVIALLWLTEALPLAVTALLVPLLAMATQTLEGAKSFHGFAHPLIFLFLGGFGMAATMSKQGLDRWLAGRILRFGRGRFYPTTMALFGVSAGLSMWISNTATTALLLPIALGLLANAQRGGNPAQARRVALFVLLGTAYAASIGGMGTLIGSPPNGIAAAELGVDFIEWLSFGLPAVLVLWPCLVGLLWFVLRPGTVADFEDTGERTSLNRSQLGTLLVFALAVCGWLASRPLSSWWGIDSGFDAMVALGAVIVMAALRLVAWSDIQRMTDWSVLLLFGGGITLSRVLSHSGASLFLAQHLQSLVAGWSVVWVVAAVVVFVMLLTEISSNTASAALLVPIFATVAIDLGMPSVQLVLPVALAASCAFMLPVATPPNAIVFGTGQIAQRDMMRVGLVLNGLILVLMGTWLW